MEKTVNLHYEEQSFPIKITYWLDNQGSVSYRAELLGSPISTFPYYKKMLADTEKECLELIGKSLIKALQELLEI